MLYRLVFSAKIMVVCALVAIANVPANARLPFEEYLSLPSSPQPYFKDVAAAVYVEPDTVSVSVYEPKSKVEVAPKFESLIDRPDFDSIITVLAHTRPVVPKLFFAPPVFKSVLYLDSLAIAAPEHDYGFGNAYQWLDEAQWQYDLMTQLSQNYMINNPDRVKYNLQTLPVPPKNFYAFVDPVTTSIVLAEVPVKPTEDGLGLEKERKNWIKDFVASLQFSQAYISPNWYQGGTRNLNMIAQAIYNVKLNQKFHPRYMFEATVQYKLGMNSAPDDTIRSYNISEDLFQANAKFGLKATKRWYYSTNVSFKTQIFNSYPSNSRKMRAAFMSPGELNVGVGMTYNRQNQRKTFSVNASISPLSWNLRTCINMQLDPRDMNIDNGHRSINDVGSNIEATLDWHITYNIHYTSRLFAFTDYDYIQGDWEHTISFDITKFLSTQIYAHLRYDSNTPQSEDTGWKKFQFKEIFSLGFNYKFAS